MVLIKKVLIIQQVIPEYRIAFFNLLKDGLAKENIELSLIYGDRSSSYKSGSDFYELEWGKLILNRTFKIGKIQLCWQPVIKHLKGNDLVIVERANKLLLNYFLIVVRRFWNIKLGFWGHGRNLQAKSNSFGNKFGLLFLKKCDRWFGYTNSVKFFLIKNKYPSDKITVVQNAIDTLPLQKQLSEINNDEIKELKRQLGIIGCKTAIFCGGMYPEKRISFILETCYIIKKEIPEFEMIFIGSGLESCKVAEASESNNWIHYVGPKTGKERLKYFKISSIQLMPGAVGLGIIDSFALETPIITTNYEYHGPEIEYLENWENGVITDNTLEIYSQTVIEILKSEKYLDLIPGCIKAASQYTIEKMVENFKGGILKCLSLS